MGENNEKSDQGIHLENIKKIQLYVTFNLVTAANYVPKKAVFMPPPYAVTPPATGQETGRRAR